jgi:hypothetical protein
MDRGVARGLIIHLPQGKRYLTDKCELNSDEQNDHRNRQYERELNGCLPSPLTPLLCDPATRARPHAKDITHTSHLNPRDR